MNSNKKLQLCIIIYLILVISLITLIFIYQTKNKYFRWGVPDVNDEPLIIISVKIDTYNKYFILLFCITIFRIVKVIITEIADPILAFTIYNPDKKNIEDFGKFELQFYANTLYFIDSIRYVFTIMLAITQIDIALFDTIIGELTTIFTIRLLLNEKTFDKLDYTELNTNI
jgi:hypothetical protein